MTSAHYLAQRAYTINISLVKPKLRLSEVIDAGAIRNKETICNIQRLTKLEITYSRSSKSTSQALIRKKK